LTNNQQLTTDNQQPNFNYTGLHTNPTGLHPEEIGAGGTIWLGRHGEVHNPGAILYGRLPGFRLGNEGLKQTTETARFLANQPLAAAYSSPLLRARQTAQVYLKYHPTLKLHTSSLLLEVRTQHQGKLLSELGDFNLYEPKFAAEDEELEDVLFRVLQFFKKALKSHPRQHILAVSHGDPVIVTHAHFVGLPINLASIRKPNLYPQTASVTRYDFPPEGFTNDIARVRVSYHHAPY